MLGYRPIHILQILYPYPKETLIGRGGAFCSPQSRNLLQCWEHQKTRDFYPSSQVRSLTSNDPIF